MKYTNSLSMAIYILLITMASCVEKSNLPSVAPDIITEKTPYDTDDPAIWVNSQEPSKSIVFGTDKETNGGVYAFDLEGKIIPEKSITGIQRPNNVDVEYQFKLNDSVLVDIMAFTERERQQIRVFSVPDMKPLDNGGFKVFENETEPQYNLPMGISLYKSPSTGKIYAIVGRKTGPKDHYLHQYELISDSLGVRTELVRAFGKFSGKKEIEAIAVDDEKGYIYYSDEGNCIRKYHAEPIGENKEISCFGSEYFEEDIEGIAIASMPDGTGYIIVSDQQKGQFNIFDRKDNSFLKAVNLTTVETDGCEVVTVALNTTFPNGLFAAMNNEKNFYFYDLDKVIK